MSKLFYYYKFYKFSQNICQCKFDLQRFVIFKARNLVLFVHAITIDFQLRSFNQSNSNDRISLCKSYEHSSYIPSIVIDI